METKICKRCGEPRPITAFRAFKSIAGGISHRKRGHICKRCTRQSRAANGQCWMCSKLVVPGKKYCEKHLAVIAKCARGRRHIDRQLVLNHYGRQCAYCEDKRVYFLTMDHINNDGAEHRRQMNKGKSSRSRSGSPIYQWLRTHGYPTGFQTLCFNCNSAKAIYGEEFLLEYLRELKEAADTGCRRSDDGRNENLCT